MKFNFLNHGIANVHAAALLLGAAGLLSRVLGIVRDRLLAGHFGAGRELDIYYAAFQIPDFMSIMFFLGAGSAAILPVFQEYFAFDQERARRLISSLLFIFLVSAVSVAFMVIIAAPALIRIIVPGFSEIERGITVTLTRILLLSPIFLGLSSIFSVVTQSFERFWAYAAAPVLYNLGIIIGILFFVPFWGLFGLGAGVILGAFLHAAIQFFTAWHLGFAGRMFWPSFDQGVKQVMKISFPRVLSISLSHLTVLILMAIGSTLAAGSIAVFQFAQNLYFLPIGIFGVSYATVVFPRMSRAYIAKDAEQFFREFFDGIRTILFWIIPSAILFIVLRAHLVRVALGSGRFTWEDTRLTAATLAVLTIGMVAGSLIIFLLRGFYALEKTWRPLMVNLISSLFSVGFAYIFILLLRSTGTVGAMLTFLFRVEDVEHIEVMGLAFGYAFGTILNTYFLYTALMRLASDTFSVRVSFPQGEIKKIIAAAASAGLVAYAVRLIFHGIIPLDTFAQVFFQAAIAGLAGITVYILILLVLGSEDTAGLLHSFRQRLFRLGVLPRSLDGEYKI